MKKLLTLLLITLSTTILIFAQKGADRGKITDIVDNNYSSPFGAGVIIFFMILLIILFVIVKSAEKK